jgi:indole-3-glycerol phosphate synthase
LLALAENYLGKGLLESCIRTLHEALAIKDIGDAGYLLGSALMKKGEKDESVHWL